LYSFQISSPLCCSIMMVELLNGMNLSGQKELFM
jgi:hypothetical protein